MNKWNKNKNKKILNYQWLIREKYQNSDSPQNKK